MKLTITPSEEMLNILREDFVSQNWDCIFRGVFIFSEDFIREFVDWYIDADIWLNGTWYNICLYQTLSENFIEKYKDHVWWIAICDGQVLSEEFILKHKNYICHDSWRYVSQRQKLSKEFIINNLIFLDLRCLLLNKNISEETKSYIRMFI